MLNRGLVEFDKPFRLRHSIIDEVGVQVLKIGQADQLTHIGVVTDVARPAWIAVAPHLGGHAEERHVEHIGFGRVDEIGLSLGQLRGNEVFPDRIGMNPIVDLRKIPADIPAKQRNYSGPTDGHFLDAR